MFITTCFLATYSLPLLKQWYQIKSHQWGGARWGREKCRDIGPPVHNMWCQEGGTRVSNTLSHTSRLLQWNHGDGDMVTEGEGGRSRAHFECFWRRPSREGAATCWPFLLTQLTDSTCPQFHFDLCGRGRMANDLGWMGSSQDWVTRRSTCCCEVVWMDWLPSKEILTFGHHSDYNKTYSKIIWGQDDLQEIKSDNVEVWPRWRYKCELRFKKRQHVYNTSSAFNWPFCNTAKQRDNTKSKLLKDILNGAQKTSHTSFSPYPAFPSFLKSK